MAALHTSPARPRSVSEVDRNTARMAEWQVELAWIGAAAVLGFTVTEVAVAFLGLPRPWVVLILTMSVGSLAVAYARHRGLDVLAIVRNRWIWALVRGLLLGGVLIALTLPEDPSSRAQGAALAVNVLWLGIVFGLVDALLLNVLPMMAAWRAATSLGWTSTWPGRMKGAVLTLGANLLVTASYHVGFPEFRGPELAGPISGNLVIGLGYVLAPNPLTSILGHIILHVAAVLAGTDGPVQLPPHY